MSAVALDEYARSLPAARQEHAEAVEDLGEARASLEEARHRAEQLSPSLRGLSLPVLDQLLNGFNHQESPGRLGSLLDGLRRRLERVLWAPLERRPLDAPSLARGAKLFQDHCAKCHGREGRGDGAEAHHPDPRPADFTQRAALRSASPLAFFRKISLGVSGTEMRGWEGLLSLEDRWALALYTSSLRYSDAERALGERRVQAWCPECLQSLSHFDETAGSSDDLLSAQLVGQSHGRLRDADALVATAFARTAAASEVLGGDRGAQVARTVGQAAACVTQAVALARRGQRQGAVSAASDAYLLLERVETPLRARDAEAAAAIDRAFAGLRGALSRESPAGIDTARGDIEAALSEARRSMSVAGGGGAPLGAVSAFLRWWRAWW